MNRQAIKIPPKDMPMLQHKQTLFIRFVMFCFLLIFYLFFFLGHCLRPHPFHSLDFNLSRGMNNKYLVNPFFTSEVKTTRKRRSSLPPTFDKPSPLALAKKIKLNGNLNKLQMIFLSNCKISSLNRSKNKEMCYSRGLYISKQFISK